MSNCIANPILAKMHVSSALAFKESLLSILGLVDPPSYVWSLSKVGPTHTSLPYESCCFVRDIIFHAFHDGSFSL